MNHWACHATSDSTKPMVSVGCVHFVGSVGSVLEAVGITIAELLYSYVAN